MFDRDLFKSNCFPVNVPKRRGLFRPLKNLITESDHTNNHRRSWTQGGDHGPRLSCPCFVHGVCEVGNLPVVGAVADKFRFLPASDRTGAAVAETNIVAPANEAAAIVPCQSIP